MQFQVPQFIEIEDKIFGPLTIKQFLYLGGGIGASIVLFIYIPYKIISVILIIPVAIFSLALAFYKVNGKTFIDVVENSFYYFLGDKLYIWKKVDKKPISKMEDQIKSAKSLLSVPKMSDSKLKDLTWSLDIKEGVSSQTEKSN
jgi:hypothetical protein